jgi:hypothetical protein
VFDSDSQHGDVNESQRALESLMADSQTRSTGRIDIIVTNKNFTSLHYTT